jgi:hypothetical protein
MTSLSASSSVSMSVEDLLTRYPFIADASKVCRDEKMTDTPLGEAYLEEIVYSLCHNICNLSTTDKTVPPQAEYNRIVLSGLVSVDTPSLIKHLIRLSNYSNEHFAESSILATLRGFKRPSKEEFNDNRALYVHDKLLDTTIGEVRDTDLIRAARLYVRNMMLRFFRTDDPDEKSENPRTKKMELRCVSERCTFRRGDRNITTQEFTQFLDDLLATQRLFLNYSDQLDEFSFYKVAALTAKKMRDDFATKRAAEKQATRDTVRSPNPHHVQNTTQQVKTKRRDATKSAATARPDTSVCASESPAKIVWASAPPTNNKWAERKKVVDETADTVVQPAPETVADAEQDPISEEDNEFATVMVRNARRGNTRRFESRAERT